MATPSVNVAVFFGMLPAPTSVRASPPPRTTLAETETSETSVAKLPSKSSRRTIGWFDPSSAFPVLVNTPEEITELGCLTMSIEVASPCLKLKLPLVAET